jgi:hypothetical protein
MADQSPYAAGRAQRIIDDERKAKAQRESEEYARNFARTQLIGQFVKSGDSEPVALKKAYSIVPSPDPKVMTEVFDAAKKAEHPKEFAPWTAPDGTTYNSNTISGKVEGAYKTPDSFTTSTNAAGVPVQVSSSGRQYPLPSIPKAPLDTSRDAMAQHAIIAQNTDYNPDSPTYKAVTNTPANLLNQYDKAIRSPIPPAQPSPVASPQSTPPKSHIDYLISNPTPKVISDFEAKYGVGSASQFLKSQ